MNKYFSVGFLVLVVSFVMSCMSGGTHGSIKYYYFPVSHDKLKEVVENVFTSNKETLTKDSIYKYYNNDTNYITFKLNENGLINNYVICYYGGKEYWDTSKRSGLFIAYAYNRDGGGSQGNGGVKWYDFKLRKELLEPFEKEFIDKIDRELATKHTEE